ncbi:MAG: thiamine-binding protein [Mycobacteriaceae bacterium]
MHAEFTTEPFRGGDDPPAHALAAFEVVREAGLDHDFGPLGTAVAGEADAVVQALADVQRAALAHGASRVTLLLEKDDEAGTDAGTAAPGAGTGRE